MLPPAKSSAPDDDQRRREQHGQPQRPHRVERLVGAHPAAPRERLCRPADRALARPEQEPHHRPERDAHGHLQPEQLQQEVRPDRPSPRAKASAPRSPPRRSPLRPRDRANSQRTRHERCGSTRIQPTPTGRAEHTQPPARQKHPDPKRPGAPRAKARVCCPGLWPGVLPFSEAPTGVEPANGGFANLCLTTWLRRHRRSQSGHAAETFSASYFRCPGFGSATQ